MASPKKNSKSNKTAHVLNLLTAPGGQPERETVLEPEPEEEAPEKEVPVEESTPSPVAEREKETASAESSAPSGRPLTPPILEVAHNNDMQVSEQIRSALEEELAGELGRMSAPKPAPIYAPTPQPTSAPTPVSAGSSGGKMSQEEIEKLLSGMTSEPTPPPAPTPAPAPTASSGGKMSQEEIEKLLSGMTSEPTPPPAPTPAPAPTASSGGKMSQEEIEKLLSGMTSEPTPPPETTPAPVAAEPEKPKPVKTPPAKPAEDPDEYIYVDIMQKLVEEKAGRYIKMFGMCTCRRCEMDVKALTLTNLIPKYLVLKRRDANAMITVYESRFNSTVFAQLTRACKIVMDNPRHDRND